MAKKTNGGVNLSEKIREVLTSGITSPKEVVEKLAGKGIEVKIGLVNNVKAKMSAGGKVSSGGGKRVPGATSASTSSPGLAAGGSSFGGRFSIQDIQNISALAKATGGYDTLIALLQAMKGT